MGLIEISAIGLEVMIWDGTDDGVLRRAVGHIPGTSLPGQQGDVAIAGHRDTFFRPLRKIRKNDEMTLTTLNGTYRYRVDSTQVIDPENTRVLDNSNGHSDSGDVLADLVEQLFNSSEKRLARILLLLAHFGKESRAEPVLPQISQDDLAQMIGTTRSRVSYFMNKFRKLGFIHYDGDDGGLTVHSGLLNVVLND